MDANRNGPPPNTARFFKFLRRLIKHAPAAPPGTSQQKHLYLALYARLKHPESYHYALHISPFEDAHNNNPSIRTSTKHHCKNTLQVLSNDTVATPWVYEAVNINPYHELLLLVRVLLCDLSSASAVAMAEEVFAAVPVVQGDPGFDCVVWVREALLALGRAEEQGEEQREGGGGERGLVCDWGRIEETALVFVKEKKTQGRFRARWEGEESSRVATWDMRVGKEVD